MYIDSVQNNQTSFQARLSIKDAGHCLSLRQKAKLKKLAKQIGEDTDRIFIATRKYDNIDHISEKHFKRSDGIILSLVDNTVVDMRFGSENMYRNFVNYLNHFSNEGHNFSKIQPNKVSEAISVMKDQIKEFCSLKRTYHRENFTEIIQKLFTRKPNPEKVARKAKEAQEFQDWLAYERYKKETQDDVDLVGEFYDTFIRPVKEELF